MQQGTGKAPADVAKKNPAAVTLGRLGGKKGGKARAAKLYHPNPGTHAFFLSVPNLARKRRVRQPDQLWVGDITYLRVEDRWRYLAAVMDRYSRRIVGWSLGENKDAQLTMCALNHAVRNRNPGPGLIFHSDRGIEYAAYAFKARLAALGLRQSMNRRGRPTDNAHMESFFHSLKSDVIHGGEVKTDEQLYRILRMTLDVPSGVTSFCRSGANPFAPEEIVQKLKDHALSIQQHGTDVRQPVE